MIRRWPLIPTILVAAAVATMIGLGLWQLQRRQEKLALLEQLSAARDKPSIDWPTAPFAGPLPLYRAASGHCLSVTGFRTAAGQNRDGDSGFLVIADCRVGAEGPGMAVELGWSKNPSVGRNYKGGLVRGIIAPDSVSRMRLVSSTPGPELAASAPPSPDSIPNNHLSYAIQWFLFAAAAAVIYVLALKRRERDRVAEPANG
ncbi:MAG: SURF1 family protein [Sphingomonas bacterium]|nr:SURF1 family protein [Sphingomonas bacterium]